MDFANIKWCGEELERVRDITKYLERREEALTPVYETLAETRRQTETACRILNAATGLVNRACKRYARLVAPDTVDTKTIQASHVEQEVGIPLSRPGPAPISAVKSRHHAATAQVADLSAKAPQPKNCGERCVDSTGSRRLPGKTLESHRSSSRRDPPIASTASAARTARSQPPAQARLRTRIKHNSGYPKPWLDPPPKRDRGRRVSTVPAKSQAPTQPLRRMSRVPRPASNVPAASTARRESMARRFGVSAVRSTTRPQITRPRTRKLRTTNGHTAELPLSRQSVNGHLPALSYSKSDGNSGPPEPLYTAGLRQPLHRRLASSNGAKSTQLHQIPEH